MALSYAHLATLEGVENKQYKRLGAYGMVSRHDEWAVYATYTGTAIKGHIVYLETRQTYPIAYDTTENEFVLPAEVPSYIQARARVVMKRLDRAVKASK